MHWLNKSIVFCSLAGDPQALHFGAFRSDQLVCAASIFTENHTAPRLRKFATITAFQNSGIGTEMLQHIFTERPKQGITHFWCDARVSAIAFYQGFDMHREGDTFSKSGIHYIKMILRFL